MLLLPPLSLLFPYTTLFRSFLVHLAVLDDFSIYIYLGSENNRLRFYLVLSLNYLDLQYNESYYIDRKSTRLNSSHVAISYAVFCLKKKNIYTSNIIIVSTYY